MKNPRIAKLEWTLIKGGINRVFSRSELRRAALSLTLIDYKDPNRPRVTRWSRCRACQKPTPAYLIEIDHKIPRVPIEATFEEMSKDEYLNRTWCSLRDLQGLCKPCHHEKSKQEKSLRRKARKAKAG